MQIRRKRAEDVGVVAGHLLLDDQKVHHFAHRQARGFVQILVQTHGDVVRWGFGAWPAQPLSFPQMQFERASERSLKGRSGDLAVPLPRVAVADREQGARHVHGQVQDRTRDQVLVVQIAAVPAGRAARDPPREQRGRDADGPEKGRKR
jgi:hypothetical protein